MATIWQAAGVVMAVLGMDAALFWLVWTAGSAVSRWCASLRTSFATEALRVLARRDAPIARVIQ